MGKRAKRWRSKAQQLKKRLASVQAPDGQRHQARADAAEKQLSAAWVEIRQLRRQLEAVEELNCFRVAVRNMPFGRMGGDMMGVQVTFDPRMIEYGIHSTSRIPYADPINLSRYLRYLAEDLACRVEKELATQLGLLAAPVGRKGQ